MKPEIWTDKDAEGVMRLLLEKMKNAPEGSIEILIEKEFSACSVEEMWMDCTFTVPKAAENRIGTAHGGYLAAILDESMGYSFSALSGDPEISPVTLDYQVNTIRALRPGQTARIHCTVDHVGKRTALCHGYIYDGDRLCATATENYALIESGRLQYSDWFPVMK